MEKLLQPRGPYYAVVAANGPRGKVLIFATNAPMRAVCDHNDYLPAGEPAFAVVYEENVSHEETAAVRRVEDLKTLSQQKIYDLIESANPSWSDIHLRKRA